MRYYKHWAESFEGEEGTVYFEIDGEIVNRQIEIYPSQTLWMTRDSQKVLDLDIADQPFCVLDLSENDRVLAEEFEKMWEKAHSD